MSEEHAAREATGTPPAQGGAPRPHEPHQAIASSKRKQITVRFLRPHCYNDRMYYPERTVRKRGEPGHKTLAADTLTVAPPWAELWIRDGIAEEVN